MSLKDLIDVKKAASYAEDAVINAAVSGLMTNSEKFDHAKEAFLQKLDDAADFEGKPLAGLKEKVTDFVIHTAGDFLISLIIEQAFAKLKAAGKVS